jgi:hypothetical protein
MVMFNANGRRKLLRRDGRDVRTTFVEGMGWEEMYQEGTLSESRRTADKEFRRGEQASPDGRGVMGCR